MRRRQVAGEDVPKEDLKRFKIRQLKRVPGIVAEDLFEAGLKELCTYDNSGLSGVAYEKLVLPLLQIVKDLKTEVDTLKEAVETQVEVSD